MPCLGGRLIALTTLDTLDPSCDVRVAGQLDLASLLEFAQSNEVASVGYVRQRELVG